MTRPGRVDVRDASRARRGARRDAAGPLRGGSSERGADFNEERRSAANREIFVKLVERYQVAIDETALVKAAAPTGKLAQR